MNCACKEWHRNGNRFRCYFGIKQGCRPAKIFANATAPFLVQKSRKVLNLWDFLENVNGSHRERNKKKLVDTNRMRLLELRMKKELVNNNRRLCYC